MRDVCTTAERVAAGDGKILITGESGVGKDLIAQYIHAQSPRAKGPFVAVNCAAFPETLLETELFGHAKGSFTGAYRDKPGRLRMAHQGTIFLDEVGEMSLRMQAQLLRFLESGEIQTVGREAGPTRVDVRIVTATNRDLAERVASGHFREDLLYRIKVIHLHVPPLRERREDVRPLVLRAVARAGRSVRLNDAALEALERYRWPGNVRELQNVVEQVSWMSKGEEVSLADLPEEIRLPPERPAPETRAPPPARQRAVRRARRRPLRLLGSHPRAVSQPRHDAPRSAPAPAQRADDDARELSRAAAALRRA